MQTGRLRDRDRRMSRCFKHFHTIHALSRRQTQLAKKSAPCVFFGQLSKNKSTVRALELNAPFSKEKNNKPAAASGLR
jgi:hypothetical protein